MIKPVEATDRSTRRYQTPLPSTIGRHGYDAASDPGIAGAPGGLTPSAARAGKSGGPIRIASAQTPPRAALSSRAAEHHMDPSSPRSRRRLMNRPMGTAYFSVARELSFFA